MRRFKKILSILLIAAIIIPLIPIGELKAWAAGGIDIRNIRIDYTYKDRDEKELDNISVGLTISLETKLSYTIEARLSNGKKQVLGTINKTTENAQIFQPRYDFKPSENVRITSISVGGETVEIEDNTPMIGTMQTYDVLLGDYLKFEGSNLNNGTMSISGLTDIGVPNATEYSHQINTGSAGYKNINFRIQGNTSKGGEVIQTITYPRIFKLMGNLNELGDKLEIIPEMGEKESIAYIRTNGKFNVKDGVGEYSVFFLADTTDKYTTENMAEIVSFSKNGNVMKIKIPKGIQDSKSYEIHVTNRIKNLKGNIDEQVLQRKTVTGKYFVIGADKSPVITSIAPAKGPDTGEVVQIGGRKFDEIDFIDAFKNIEGVKVKESDVKIEDKVLDNVIDDIIGSEGVETDGKEESVLHLPYDLDEATGLTYGGKSVESINRYIATYVGDRTTPHIINNRPVFKFDTVFDNISVKIPPSNVDSERQVNVIMVIQTEIVADGIKHTIVNIVTNDKIKYTIIPSHTRPSITKILPDKIQVVKNSGDYGLKEDMIITVEGTNFRVIRSKDNTTGKDRTYYPIVGIGADVLNSKEGIVLRVSPTDEGLIEINTGGDNWTALPGADMTILDAKGNIIDGTVDRDIGSKIIVNLPRNWNDIKIPSTSVTTNPRNPVSRPVFVRNPVLGSSSPGEPVSNDTVTVMFMDIDDTPSPTIDRVTPNVVAIDSGEEVTITGSNFAQGARVFVAGVEVTGVKQELDPSGLNTLLKFNAPKFPQIIEGPTKIMVMNPDGGIAVKDFTYVKSLQRDPVLTNFTPKSGTKDTIVVIDGDNFLAPNPSVTNTSGMGIYRLIGTRVLMDGKDINEYNTNSNGSIVLQNYGNGSELLISSDGGVAALADYAHSIILVDESRANSYYNIYTDNRGNIFLSDGGSGAEENNIINQYAISLKGDKLIADKGGKEYDVNPYAEGLELSGNGETLNLKMKTLYKFAGTDIYGSRVQVKDKNRIEFKVPQLTSKLPGGYKITVENPDTKKSTAKDLFNYYETASKTPKITAIKPAIGTVEGGYQVLIEGSNFEDTSKVYIDGILVPQNNVKREIRGGRDTIIITSMPAYGRDMNQEDTDRKVVPVVVENGNGGTDINRFTYVIPPSAKPIIEKAEFQKEKQIGSAAGDEILTLTGKYFKFEEPWALTPKYKGWIEGTRNGNKIYFEDLDGDEKFTSYNNWRDYNGRKEKLPNPIETYTEHLSSPVLPTIRIGGIEAKIVEFGDGYIRVVTPQISVGRHELYLVNNDFGTSNKVVLNFEGSNVKIDKVVPDVGKKQGKDSIEITGTGFQNRNIYVMENNAKKQYNMPLVKFGQVDGTKDINNNMATVVLEKGDFTLDYNNTDATSAEITVSAKYNNEIYTKIFHVLNYGGEEIFLPIGELKTSDNKIYPGFELIKVKVDNRKLIVEKGYSPEAKLDNPGKISLKTPSYYSIGDVQVLVSNADGGKGTSKFKYTNPASKPKIENITRDGKDPDDGDNGEIKVIRLDYRGGQNITVLGEDFRTATSIKIGDILSIDNKDITETLNALPNKLSFTMPGVNENIVGNLYRVTLINGDGATVSSDTKNNKWNVPIYIQFIKGESDPELGDIVPNKGPATGGTKVTIKGKDFRETMEGYDGKTLTVFFGDVEVPANNVKIIDHNTLEIIAPPSPKLGPVPVKIENPDGTQTMGNLVFTYISKPKIDDMNPKKLFTNDKETVVTITGEQFLPGAKVIIGGKTIPTKDVKGDMVLNGSGITGVDKDGNNIESSVVNGKETATAVVEGDGTIKITFGETTDLENTSIIVINPDGGISEPYNDFKHEKPVPLKPMVLEGIPGYESTVQLIWSKSDENILNKATRYEIYGRKTSDKENTFLGDTNNAEFLIKGLEPNIEYEFLVRALNEHGAAIDFATVKVKTLSLSEDKKLKEKEEKRKEQENKIKLDGKEEIQNGRLVVTLGSKVFKNGVGTLDLSLSKYKSQDKFTIAIPIELARTDNRLTIKDGTMTSVINARDLYTLAVSRLDKGDKDAYLRIHIDRTIEQHIPRGKKAASKAYELYFDYIYEKDSIKINEILRNGKLSLSQDLIVYPNNKNSSIYIFNVETGNYTNLKAKTTDIKGRKKVMLLSDR